MFPMAKEAALVRQVQLIWHGAADRT